MVRSKWLQFQGTREMRSRDFSEAGPWLARAKNRLSFPSWEWRRMGPPQDREGGLGPPQDKRSLVLALLDLLCLVLRLRHLRAAWGLFFWGCFQATRNNLKGVKNICLCNGSRQGQNLTFAILYVPLLDIAVFA